MGRWWLASALTIIPRRSALVFLGFVAFALTACRTMEEPTRPHPNEAQVVGIARNLVAVAEREPHLSGVRSIVQISERFAGMSADDQSMLEVILHQEARERLRRISRPPIGAPEIRAMLAAPVDTSRFSGEAFAQRLVAARERAATDPSYRAELALIRPNDPFFHGHCESWLGNTVPCSLAVYGGVMIVVYGLWLDP